MHFSFEKHAPSQILKDFSVENLEATPSIFLSKVSSEITLSRIINYWGSIFTLYLTWGVFSLVCVLSIFLFSFFLLCFLFPSVFFLTDTNDSQEYREGSGSPYFLCFPLSFAHEHSFISSRFLLLLFNRTICNYQTDSWWDLFYLEICILFVLSLMQLSRVIDSDISGIVRIWAHIKLSPFYYKANALTGVFYAYTAVCSVNSSYLFSRTKQERNCWNNYLIKSAMYLLIFRQNPMIFEGSLKN